MVKEYIKTRKRNNDVIRTFTALIFTRLSLMISCEYRRAFSHGKITFYTRIIIIITQFNNKNYPYFKFKYVMM